MLRLKIEELLKAKGMSRYKLHLETQVRANTINEYVSNTAKSWSPEILEKICNVLDVKTIDELMEYVPEEKMNETKKEDLCN